MNFEFTKTASSEFSDEAAVYGAMKLLRDQALAGHFGGLGQTHQLQHSGRQVGQTAAFAELGVLAAGINQNEGHLVGGVRGEEQL